MDQLEVKKLSYEENQPIEAFQQQLINTYKTTFQSICDRTTTQVIETRYETFRTSRQQRTRNKAETYLQAMQFFYGEKMKMGAIASVIGLNRQEDVTHLLALNAMRADIQRILIHDLITALHKQLQHYPDPDDPHVQAALQVLKTLSPESSFTLETAPPLLKTILQEVDDLLQQELKQSYTAHPTAPTSRLGLSIVKSLLQLGTRSPYVKTS